MTTLEQEIADVNELLEMFQRHVQVLRMQHAMMGPSTPPHIIIGIEDVQRQIRAHKKKLAQLKRKQARSPARSVPSNHPNGSATVTVAFQNRDAELASLRDPFGKPFVFISAPPGFGKTFLLQKVETVLQTSPQNWLCAHHECRADDTEVGILQSLVQATGSAEKSPISGIVDFLGRLNRVRDAQASQALLVVFDRVEEWQNDSGWNSTAHFVLGTFAQAIDETIMAARLPYKVLLAGRYIVDLASHTQMPIHEMSLSPFGFRVIREYVRDSIRQTQNNSITLESTRLDEVTEHILAITGGHPNAVRLLINEYRFNGFTIPPRLFFDVNRSQQLFHVFVTDQMKNLLRGVPECLYNVLRVLCVFRRFNGDTLNALISNGFLPQQEFPDGWDLFNQIRRTSVVGVDSFFAHDHILRSLLDTELCFTMEARWLELHEFAATLYDKWLAGKHHDDSDLAIGIPTGDLQIALMLERLYHVCQMLKQPVDKSIVMQEIASYPPRLVTLGGKQEGRHALRQALERDETLYRLLKRILGESDLKVALESLAQQARQRPGTDKQKEGPNGH